MSEDRFEVVAACGAVLAGLELAGDVLEVGAAGWDVGCCWGSWSWNLSQSWLDDVGMGMGMVVVGGKGGGRGKERECGNRVGGGDGRVGRWWVR